MVVCDQRVEERLLTFAAPTQLISDMIKGDTPNQLVAKFLQLWKGKKPIRSKVRSGWPIFSTCGTAQEFIIKIIFFRKCSSSYIEEISNYSQEWLNVWENRDNRTSLAKELLSQFAVKRKSKTKKREVLNKVNELLYNQYKSEEILLFLPLWQNKQKIADCLQMDR